MLVGGFCILGTGGGCSGPPVDRGRFLVLVGNVVVLGFGVQPLCLEKVLLDFPERRMKALNLGVVIESVSSLPLDGVHVPNAVTNQVVITNIDWEITLGGSLGQQA